MSPSVTQLPFWGGCFTSEMVTQDPPTGANSGGPLALFCCATQRCPRCPKLWDSQPLENCVKLNNAKKARKLRSRALFFGRSLNFFARIWRLPPPHQHPVTVSIRIGTCLDMFRFGDQGSQLPNFHFPTPTECIWWLLCSPRRFSDFILPLLITQGLLGGRINNHDWVLSTILVSTYYIHVCKEWFLSG